MIIRSRLSNRQGGIKAALAAVLLAGTSPAIAAEYIVKFKAQDQMNSFVTKQMLESTQAAFAITDLHAPASLVKLDFGKLSQAEEASRLAALMQRPDVAYVVENFKIDMLGVPNDPQFSDQWALSKVRAAEAWDTSVGSRQVTVAVIDTGVDTAHADLKDNIWTNTAEIAGNGIDDDQNGFVDDLHGYDFLDNDADPADVTSAQNPGHGTHCAGIVGGIGDNQIGISGMSQRVSIMPLRFIGPSGQGDLMAAIKSIDYAIANKADIISASWGARVAASQAQPLIEAIGRANDAGVIFVAAAANDGANNDSVSMFPANAAFPNMIAVAASDNNDSKPSWSNYGRAKVALSSPGQDIISTLPAGRYGSLSGTSMATPLVAGLVALLRAQTMADDGRVLNGAEMRSLLQTTGAKVAIETACMCRVDAAAATAALANRQLIVVPAAATFAVNETGRFSAVGGSNAGYSFQSSNSDILQVAADGSLVAKALGEATVRVTDSAGQTADSLTIRVADPQQGGGGGEECPLQDPVMCELMCAIEPSLPWCSGAQ